MMNEGEEAGVMSKEGIQVWRLLKESSKEEKVTRIPSLQHSSSRFQPS